MVDHFLLFEAFSTSRISDSPVILLSDHAFSDGPSIAQFQEMLGT